MFPNIINSQFNIEEKKGNRGERIITRFTIIIIVITIITVITEGYKTL